MRCLQQHLETSFAPWPGIRDTLDDILDWARNAGLRPDAMIDATEHTKPTYLDHGDADDRPGAAQFSSSEGVQTFVEMHRSNELRIAYLSFERPGPVEEP